MSGYRAWAILFWRMAPGLKQTTRQQTGKTMSTLEDHLPREKLKGAPTAIPASYASGTIWPHGEWSYGYAKERPNGGEWHENPLRVSARAEERICDGSAGQFLPLDLSDAASSHKRPARGKRGITGYGQQMVKAAGFLLQKNYPQHRKTLGTITLPSMTQEERAMTVEQWPEFVRELLQYLTRWLVKQELPPAIVSVTEIQPKRLAESEEACLHLHLLWLNHPGRAGNWAIDPCDVRAWVDSWLLRNIPGYSGGHVNVDTRQVKGQVAAYLAKYMSKGKQAITEAIEDWGEDIHPHTWYNLTAKMRNAVKAATKKGRQVGLALEFNLARGFELNAESHFEFLRKIEIEFDGIKFTAGWRGRFTAEVHRYITWHLSKLDNLASADVECA